MLIHPTTEPSRIADLVPNVVAASVATVVCAFVGQQLLNLSAGFALKALAVFGFGAACLIALARRHLKTASFGAANRVTLARGALIAMLFALADENASAQVAWLSAAAVGLVLVLDGIDGRLARSRGEASDFGARFDMETDALLILIAAVLVCVLGKAGAWILAAGLMRYAFVAASWVVPRLRQPLPSSRRRQAICVVQGLSLLICLVPTLPPAGSNVVALFGLTMLSGSFAIDVAWLLRVPVILGEPTSR
jgi:phosphatidylglycerophosphate synthase